MGQRTLCKRVSCVLLAFAVCIPCFFLSTAVGAFSFQPRASRPCTQCNGHSHKAVEHDDLTTESSTKRRSFLTTAFGGIVAVTTAAASLSPALAVMSNDSPEAQLFQAGQAMGTDEALARFVKGRESLTYLLKNYDDIVANGGGDNVRRYLGTVGVTSGLYGIPKVLKELQEAAEDIVEYTEAMNEFDASLRQADTACYSANFVEYSAAKTKPEKFFQDAKIDAERMQTAMNEMAKQLNIK